MPRSTAEVLPSFLKRVPTSALWLSSKSGMFTAPGICPYSYSEGDLTSTSGISAL